MATLPNCIYSVMAIDAGSLCVEAAADQGLWRKNMPTIGDWIRGNWFIFLAVGLIIALCVIGIALSAARWCRRIQHRHKREERNKRVDGMLRLVSASFHGTLSRRGSMASSRASSFSGISEAGESAGSGCRSIASSRQASQHNFTNDGEASEDDERYPTHRSANNNNYNSNNKHPSPGGVYSRSMVGRDDGSDFGGEGEQQQQQQQQQQPPSARHGSYNQNAAVAGPRGPARTLAADAQPKKRGRRPKKQV